MSSSLLDDPELRALASEFADELAIEDGGEIDDIDFPDMKNAPLHPTSPDDDDDEDFGLDGEGAVGDAAVAGELAALAAEVAAEGANSEPQNGTESDDELAALEAAEVTPKSAALSAAPRPGADAAAIRADIAAARANALALRKAGKTAEAIEALRGVKYLEQKLALAERVEKGAHAQQSTDLMQSRLREYQTAAVNAKKANRLDAAREYLTTANQIKSALEKGQNIELPPPPKALKDNQSEEKRAQPVKQTKPAQQAASSSISSSSSSKPPPSSAVRLPSSVPAPLPVPSAGSSALRTELSYDALLSRLQSQIDMLTAQVKSILVAGRASESSKSLALSWNRWKVRTQNDLDLVKAAQKKKLPTPGYHEERVVLKEELRFESLGDDVIQVEVLSGSELRASKESGLTPEDLNPFVVCKLEYGDAEPSFTSENKKKTANPEWNNAVKEFKIEGRSKAAIRKVKAGKLVFTVYHKRFLLSAIEIGHGDVKLKELMNRAEIVESMKLRGAEARKAGELSVRVRVKAPFETPDVREVEKMLVVVDEFYENPESKAEAAPSSAAPSSAPASGAASSSQPESKTSEAEQKVSEQKSAAAPLPSGVTEDDLTDPHRISDIFSNDVLESEIQLAQSKLAQAQAAKNAEEATELSDRLLAAQTQLTVLVTAVQNGNLSLDRYLEKLKESIQHGQSVAVALNQRGRKSDALQVLRRVKIMQKEVQTAEENRDQLEEE